ncbi:hypothetical protein MVES1_001335 [Malassezia vespertilionis]|uniref:Trs120p n=1 Tax=Malassezia vespertilionis TaxID=2020962 RepID=A0A2N1JEG7_9BASI|nr:uncharacterized protein MVES1_001335 [Malassezia vespertilionis]PKI84935.1 hypothetical protein MVES_001254 [Malassezia vespertilionis]WFD05997.1 hypothetical protein MVES1_001335 [Malassezia vespertilionis]
MAAPTFAAQGTAAFSAPAKLKILLVPALPLEHAEFEKWAAFVRNIECLRLRDVPRKKSSVYPSSPLYQQGEVHISFVTSYDPAHAYLAPMQLHTQVLGVLGLSTHTHTDPYTNELVRVPGILRDEHPDALVHRVFAFDVDARHSTGERVPNEDDGDMATVGVEHDTSADFNPAFSGFGGRRDGGLIVFPAVRSDAKDVRFYVRTLLAEMVGTILDQLDTLLHSLEGAALETPRETLRNAIAASAAHPIDPNAPPLPPRVPPNGAASKVFGVLAKRRAAPALLPTVHSGPHGKMRHTKLRADAMLLGGDLWSALSLYDGLLTPQARERALAGGQDAVWFASALEGWSVARMLVARLGSAVQDDAPGLAFTLHLCKDKDPREQTLEQYAWKDISEAYSLALNVYTKCLAPPHVHLESLRSVTNETLRDYTPPFVHANACLAYARFLLALWSSGGWNGEAFDQMLFGGTPPALTHAQDHTQLSAVSGVYRHEIASAAVGALSPALRMLPPGDQIAILSGVAKILALLHFARRFAHVVRQLDAVVAAVLTRSLRQRERTMPRMLSIEALLHDALRLRVPTNDTALDAELTPAGIHASVNPSLVLGLLVCDTYGIDLLTCPLAHVPPHHMLSRARRRVCVEQYAALLAATLGDLPAARTLLPALAHSTEAVRTKTDFGWTALQTQLLKDLVVQSEALGDPVATAFFAALLLRDFCPALSAADQRMLFDGVRRILPRARADGAPQLSLRYHGPRDLLRAMEVVSLPAARAPITRRKASFAPPLADSGDARPAGTLNPFFWNVLKTSRGALDLVAMEPVLVDLTLENPLHIPLEIQRMVLCAEGVQLDTPSVAITIPPRSLRIVRLQGTPACAGTLRVLGCVVTLWGSEPHALYLPTARPPVVKATGLDARPSVQLVRNLAQKLQSLDTPQRADVDACLAGPRLEAVCRVHDPMPQLHASLPSRVHTALSLLQGEQYTMPVRLANPSAYPINFVRLALSDSLQGPMRDAITQRGLLPGDVHELEWQLLYAPVLSVEAHDALEIAPHSARTVHLHVYGKAGCEWASMRIYYGNTSLEARDVQLRTVQLTIPLSVQPSVQSGPLHVTGMREKDAAQLAAQLMHRDEPVPLGPSFLLSVDMHNVAQVPLSVTLDVDMAAGVHCALTRSIAPNHTARFAVPMSKRNLAPAALRAPIPKLSPGQFVVSRTKLNDATRAMCETQFWLRDAWLQALRASWLDERSKDRGDISLRTYWPTLEQIRVMSEPKVRATLALPDKVAAESFVAVQVTIANHTEETLNMRLHLTPSLDGAQSMDKRVQYARTQVLVADGSWTTAVKPVAPGASTVVRRKLCFLAGGTYTLVGAAEVLPALGEQHSGAVFPTAPTTVDVRA